MFKKIIFNCSQIQYMKSEEKDNDNRRIIMWQNIPMKIGLLASNAYV